MSLALIAVFCSVLMHVGWNLMARHLPARTDFLWWGLLAHLILFGPLGLYGLYQYAQWSPSLIIAMATTALANSLYFISLRQAYQYASVSLVYPMARSAPLFIALWSWLLFNEQLPSHTWLGIIISVIGLWLLAFSQSPGDSRPAIPWALSAAFFTSLYSISDKHAIGSLPHFSAIIGFVSSGYLCAFISLCLHRRRQQSHIIPKQRPAWYFLLAGSLFIGNAYALVIYAMQALPAAYVVALTNSGIVIAVVISIFIIKEKQQWQRRLLASLLILIGLWVM